jgi:hypothetical protein
LRRSGSGGGLNLLHQRVGVGGAAREHHRVHDGDADGAADVAHHVEKPRGITHDRDGLQGQRHADGRQDAQRHGGTARDLRPEHLRLTGGHREIGIEGKTAREDHKAHGRQHPRVKTPVKPHAHGRCNDLREPHDDGDEADLQRRHALHEGKEDGKDID